MVNASVVAVLVLFAGPAAGGPPPTIGQAVAGVGLGDGGALDSLELEASASAIGLGIGAGLLFERAEQTTGSLRLLLQFRPVGLFSGISWETTPLQRWFDPFVSVSAGVGGGEAFRGYVAADAGVDFGLWTSRWHPVVGVRVRRFVAQTPDAPEPLLLVVLGTREMDDW